MPRRQNKTDPDAELRAKYGGSGMAGERINRTNHDTFIDIMSGKEKTVAQWKSEVAPMKQRARGFREAHANKVRWGR